MATFCKPASRIIVHVRSATWSISFWCSRSVLILGMATSLASVATSWASLVLSQSKTSFIDALLEVARTRRVYEDAGQTFSRRLRGGAETARSTEELRDLRSKDDATDDRGDDAG